MTHLKGPRGARQPGMVLAIPWPDMAKTRTIGNDKLFGRNLRHFVLFVFSLLLLPSLGFGAGIPRNAGFEARIEKEMCESKFPYHKWIERMLLDEGSFQLFTFTASKFDGNKPTILFIDGGPGGIPGPKMSNRIAEYFPNHNLVLFHYRGGGCSHFESLDPLLDKYIRSSFVVEDIEIIRKTFQINKWDGIYAVSYGTTVARKYKKKYSQNANVLILEALDPRRKSKTESSKSDTNNLGTKMEKQSKIIPSKNETLGKILLRLAAERNRSSSLINSLSDGQYSSLEKLLGVLLTDYSIDDYIKFLLAIPIDSIETIPGDFIFDKRRTFISIVKISYLGKGHEFLNPLVVLLDEFKIVNLKVDVVLSARSALKNYAQNNFPQLYESYLDRLSWGFISRRVLKAINRNDAYFEDPMEVCINDPMLILNGALDPVTPVENVFAYLSNKSCAGGNNVALIVEKTGHSVLDSNTCLKDYIVNTLNSGHFPKSLDPSCQSVEMKNY